MSQVKETEKSLNNLQDLLREFKQTLAKRLWALTHISEAEKELLFKEYLSDLGKLEKELSNFHEWMGSNVRVVSDENELLRSLMGLPEDDLRVKVVGQGQELNALLTENADLKEELKEIKSQLANSEEENKYLRKSLQESEDRLERFQMGQVKEREGDIKFFSEANESLKNELEDLEDMI